MSTNIIKVKLLSLALNEGRRGKLAYGEVEVNGNKKKVTVSEDYVDGKDIVVVDVDSLDKATLEIMKTTLDTSEVSEQYKVLIEQKKRNDAEEYKRKRTEYYNNGPLDAVKKLMPFLKYDRTLEKYTETNSWDKLSLIGEIEWKGTKIKIAIEHEAVFGASYSRPTNFRYVIRNTSIYKREGTRRVTKVESVKAAYYKLLEDAKAKIDYNEKTNEKNTEVLAALQKRFGNDIRPSEIYRRRQSGGHYSEKCYELKYGDKAIKFKPYYNDGTYCVLSINTELTADQLEQVLNVLKTADNS